MELNFAYTDAPDLVAAVTETTPAPRRAPRRAPYTSETEIVVLVPNPKRPGSATHARFELYTEHTTVGAFLAAGGRRVDLAWDLEHEFIALSTPIIGTGLSVHH